MLQDFRFALRQLLKSPGFSVVAVLTLALAIGANTAIFSAVDAVLLHPLSYPHPGRLVVARENLLRYGLTNLEPTAPEMMDIRRLATSFSQVGAARGVDATLTGSGQPEDLEALRVTASVFPMLGATPVAGNLFTGDDEQLGRDHVAIISEGLWTRRFGADPSIVGKNIQINREPYRVAGVVRQSRSYPLNADIWMPLAFTREELAPGSSGRHDVDVIGRLKPGITIERARDEFRGIAARMGELYPDQYPSSLGFSIDLERLAQRQAGDLRMPLLVLIAAVGALMLIACANVSNLVLARAMLRRREISIRVTLGAARGRIIRQLLTESLLLAAIGGTAGVLLAMYALRLYANLGPQNLIHGIQPGINMWVMGFSLLLSVGASVLFGFAPAVDTSRVELSEASKEGARGSSAGRRWLRESMVAGEVAVSLILLIGAGLLLRSFVRLERTSPGFSSENVLTAQVSLPVTDYREPAQRAAFARSLLDRVRSLPGVRSASAATSIPYGGGPEGPLEIVGHPWNPNAPAQLAMQTRASPGYFQTLRIPILRGLDIRPSDEQGSPPVAVVDETVAKFFPNLDLVGMQVRLAIPRSIFTIVGIAGPTKSRDLSGPPTPRIYYSGPQVPGNLVALMIKTAGDPTQLISAVRHETATLDSNLPVSFKPMDQWVADSLARQRFSIQLMAAFAAIAALLAAIGIYGVLAYLVDQRRRELGIRMALGAHPGEILALVLRQGSVPVAAGLIAGMSGAFGLRRLLRSLLYEVSATDPLVFAAVSLGLILVSLVAMSIPAQRATRVDPLEALRQE
jgi:putative ABC transport system permease protein